MCAGTHEKSKDAMKKHTFENVRFSLLRVLLDHVKGPLANYVKTSGLGSRWVAEELPEDLLSDRRLTAGVAGPTGESAFPCPPAYEWSRHMSLTHGVQKVPKIEVGRRVWVNLIVTCLSFWSLGVAAYAHPRRGRGNLYRNGRHARFSESNACCWCGPGSLQCWPRTCWAG